MSKVNFHISLMAIAAFVASLPAAEAQPQPPFGIEYGTYGAKNPPWCCQTIYDKICKTAHVEKVNGKYRPEKVKQQFAKVVGNESIKCAVKLDKNGFVSHTRILNSSGSVVEDHKFLKLIRLSQPMKLQPNGVETYEFLLTSPSLTVSVDLTSTEQGALSERRN